MVQHLHLIILIQDSKWAIDLSAKHNENQVIVGMEPTGHYWFNIGHFLKEKGIKLVLVNPMHVKNLRN